MESLILGTDSGFWVRFWGSIQVDLQGINLGVGVLFLVLMFRRFVIFISILGNMWGRLGFCFRIQIFSVLSSGFCSMFILFGCFRFCWFEEVEMFFEQLFWLSEEYSCVFSFGYWGVCLFRRSLSFFVFGVFLYWVLEGFVCCEKVLRGF